MKTSRLKLWLRRKIGWLIGLTIVGGLGAGILLNRALHAIPTAQHRPIPRLIHDLQRQDSTLDKIWQTIWPVLPDVITTRFPGLRPQSAISIRQDAAEELRFRGTEAHAAVPALISALNDTDMEVRSLAIRALAEFGPLANAAVPNLIAFFQTSMKTAPAPTSSDLRGAAALALAAIGPKDPRVLVLLNEIMRLKDFSPQYGVPQIQSYVVTGLERIAATNLSAIPLLIAALKESGTEFEAMVIPGGGINPTTPEESMAALLARQVQQAPIDLSAQILGALGRIGPRVPEVIPTLIAALRSQNYTIRASAVEALGHIGPEAESAVPSLLELLTNAPPDYPRSEGGLRMLPPNDVTPDRSRQPGIVRATPTPTQSLDRGVPLPRRLEPANRRSPSGIYYSALPHLILPSLGKIGPGAKAALPLLVEEARNPTSPFRLDAAMARWQIDHQTDEVIPVLRDGLSHTDVKLRRRIASFLGTMGSEALPEMVATLSNDDMGVRIIVIEYLASLGPAAQSTVPLLEQACSDPKFVVRAAAERALSQIEPARTERRRTDPTSKSATDKRSR
jgi:HEAT repeat protein